MCDISRCCREILVKKAFDTAWKLFCLDVLTTYTDRQTHWQMMVSSPWALYPSLPLGMWWCLVAAKFLLGAWCDDAQEDLALCSQRQRSKRLSKSAHFTLLCLWKSQTDISPWGSVAQPQIPNRAYEFKSSFQHILVSLESSSCCIHFANLCYSLVLNKAKRCHSWLPRALLNILFWQQVVSGNDSFLADWPPRVRSQYKPQQGFHQTPTPLQWALEICRNFCNPQLSKAAFLS